jgi:hypothetical protein
MQHTVDYSENSGSGIVELRTRSSGSAAHYGKKSSSEIANQH